MSIDGGNGQTRRRRHGRRHGAERAHLDSSGNPVSGLTVTFTVTSGGGSITGGTDVTGDDGIAEVGSWTLGSTPGANTLQRDLRRHRRIAADVHRDRGRPARPSRSP